jgi:hypothetical protein
MVSGKWVNWCYIAITLIDPEKAKQKRKLVITPVYNNRRDRLDVKLSNELFLRAIFLFVAFEPFQNGELAAIVFRELEPSGPWLGEEFRFRLGKNWKCSTIVKFH